MCRLYEHNRKLHPLKKKVPHIICLEISPTTILAYHITEHEIRYFNIPLTVSINTKKYILAMCNVIPYAIKTPYFVYFVIFIFLIYIYKCLFMEVHDL